MPVKSPTARRLRGELVDKRIGRNTAAARDSGEDSASPAGSPTTAAGPIKRGSSALTSKGRKQQEKQSVPQWLVYFLIFVVVGGSVVQIITNIWTQPSMSDTH